MHFLLALLTIVLLANGLLASTPVCMGSRSTTCSFKTALSPAPSPWRKALPFFTPRRSCSSVRRSGRDRCASIYMRQALKRKNRPMPVDEQLQDASPSKRAILESGYNPATLQLMASQIVWQSQKPTLSQYFEIRVQDTHVVGVSIRILQDAVLVTMKTKSLSSGSHEHENEQAAVEALSDAGTALMQLNVVAIDQYESMTYESGFPMFENSKIDRILLLSLVEDLDRRLRALPESKSIIIASLDSTTPSRLVATLLAARAQEYFAPKQIMLFFYRLKSLIATAPSSVLRAFRGNPNSGRDVSADLILLSSFRDMKDEHVKDKPLNHIVPFLLPKPRRPKVFVGKPANMLKVVELALWFRTDKAYTSSSYKAARDLYEKASPILDKGLLKLNFPGDGG